MSTRIIDDVNFTNDGRTISISFYKESIGIREGLGTQTSAGGVCIDAKKTKHPQNISDWLGRSIETGTSGTGFQVKVGGQTVYPVASP